MTRRNQYLAILCIAVLSGCTANTPPTSNPPPSAAPSTNANPTPPATPQEIVVSPIDAAGLEAAIAKHQGKVVLVDYWATWCVPCLKAFPHTVALSRKYGDKPFVAISVTVNSADELEDAKKFLAEKDARFEHFIGSYPSTEESLAGFGLEEGSVPELRLYDQTGKLHATWKKFDEAEVETKIQELLAAP
jgi:thiol-disulfide isomerase/thioredoxin